MSTLTLRHYKNTLAYNTSEHSRRIRDMKRSVRTRISRRRAKQAIRNVLHTLNLS